MIPEKLGKYKIIRLLGEGGMSRVFEAEHTFLKKRVAVKVLNNELASKSVFRERFKNEALIMAKLDHPNIAGIIDFEEDDDSLAIIMEYVEGLTLSEHVQQQGGLKVQEAVEVQKILLRTFAYAHHRGIIHRDVKPSNIIIEPDKGNLLKVLDFGIAKFIHGDANLTGTGMQMGTPMYMSPEQVRDSKHIDHRSDIYSLGVLFYFLLTGKSPYNVNTLEIYSKILNEKLPQIINYPKLNAIVKKATGKNADERYQSCEEFLVFLEKSEEDFRSVSKVKKEKPEKNIIEEPEEETLIEKVKIIANADDVDTDGYLPHKENGKWGFTDSDGNVLIPFEYDEVSVFKDGLAAVEKDDKIGFIDKYGNVVVPISYDYASDFNNGLAKVSVDGKYGIINTEGNAVVPVIYDDVHDFKERLAAVRKKKKWGFVNLSGDVEIPFLYDYIISGFKNGKAEVKIDGKNSIIKSKKV